MTGDRGGGIFRPGDLLNNTYRIEAMLGRGGTSEVYRARSEISGRVVALKALRSEFSRNEDYLALMRREEDMREIRHDAIVRYYDNQRTDDGHVYLVMDFVDGPALEARLKQGGMAARDLMTVAARVADGLAAAHARKIVHRDLSPDNIILRNGDPADAVIIDFGIAKDSNPGAETIVGNEFAGKYAYAAPEQLSGRADARSDIYALGALLLATFRGKQPAPGANPMEVVQRKNLPLDTAGLPEPLKSLIDRMTDPDPDRRFQSAQSVAEAIRGGGAPAAAAPAAPVADERTVIAPPRSVPRGTPSAPRPAPVAAAPAAAAPAARGGVGGAVKAAVVALVLAAAGGGAYFSGLLDPLLGPSLPLAQPYTLTVGRSEGQPIRAEGHVPTPEMQAVLTDIAAGTGGSAALTLARGALVESWATDVEAVIRLVAGLPEWRVEATDNALRVTALTNDPAEHRRLADRFAAGAIPPALTGAAEIELGPRILSPGAVQAVLDAHADCGPLQQVDPPTIGYPNGATIRVTGALAAVASRAGLSDALGAIKGSRALQLDAEMLNEALCKIDAALPDAPPGGFEVAYGYGDRPEPNPTGRYFVGENPVIDVVIPAGVTDGYLFVSVLDVSGNVFHLLPNLNRQENGVAALRGGAAGAVPVRVAWSLAERDADPTRLSFLVDDAALGKGKIVVLHADTQVFGELRPTTESGSGYAEALRGLGAPVRSLDGRTLTTAARP
jgi:serine/threonine-protein kinase